MLSKVLPEDWDAPEHLSLSERDFLVTRAEAIQGIVAKSYLDVGRVLLQVKRKFKRDPEMNGWFTRWCDECLPEGFNIAKARTLCLIAEAAEEREDVREILDKNPPGSYQAFYKVICLPKGAQEPLIDHLLNGGKVSVPQLVNIKKLPEVQLETVQELVDQIQATLLKYQLAGDRSNEIGQQKRLAKALQQLQEAEEKVASLGKSQSVQDAILAQLKRQLKQQEVQIEEINLDPEQKRKRSLAKTVVDATTSLDLLLSALDRYGTDKPELGAQAIQTIERKMAQVKERLLEQYAKEAI